MLHLAGIRYFVWTRPQCILPSMVSKSLGARSVPLTLQPFRGQALSKIQIRRPPNPPSGGPGHEVDPAQSDPPLPRPLQPRE